MCDDHYLLQHLSEPHTYSEYNSISRIDHLCDHLYYLIFTNQMPGEKSKHLIELIV